MSDKSNPDLQASGTSPEFTPPKNEKDTISSISEEEGLKSAEKIFKTEESNTDDTSPDENREFLKFLRYRKRAKELGLNDPSTTIYQGGIHVKDSNLHNYGNLVGNDQIISSDRSIKYTEDSEAQSSECDKEIESVFDECEDIAQRSFMIALAALNGCNYRIVVEASQKLQTIIQLPSAI